MSRLGAREASAGFPWRRNRDQGEKRGPECAEREERKKGREDEARGETSLLALFTLMTPAAGSNFSAACERATFACLTHGGIPWANSIFLFSATNAEKEEEVVESASHFPERGNRGDRAEEPRRAISSRLIYR